MLTWFRRAASLVQPSGAAGSSFSRTAGETSSVLMGEYAEGETAAAVRNTRMAVVRVFIVPPLTGSKHPARHWRRADALTTAKLVPAGEHRSRLRRARQVTAKRSFPLLARETPRTGR